MELVKIHKTSGGESVVSARDLYAYLNIKTDFTNWCKRMFEYGFTENADYALAKNGEPDSQPNNPNPRIDYALTLDCAKEISMLQRTEKGKKAREYFIACEKQLRSGSYNTPVSYADALRQLAEKVEAEERLKQIIEVQRPAVEFYNSVADSKDAIPMGDAAKILNMGIGRNDLFKFLRDHKVLMSNNMPYQEFCDRGYFRVIEQKYNKPDGSIHISTKTLVYQKGIQYMKKILTKV